jgi:hypothetical protein
LGVLVKAVFGASAALAVCCVLAACGEDYQGGGRQQTLPGTDQPERDASPDVEEEPENDEEPPEDERDS